MCIFLKRRTVIFVKIGYTRSPLEMNTIRVLATMAVWIHENLCILCNRIEIALGRETRAERQSVNLGANPICKH